MSALLSMAVIAAAIGIVVWPLLKRTGHGEQLGSTEDTELGELLLQRDITFSAVSELESDYAMGNLSSSDYSELRQKYAQKAVSIIKDIDDLHKGQDEEIEREVLELRRRMALGAPEAAPACASCGAELNPDDNFCSRCGESASPICPNCGAGKNAGERFCSQCGARLDGEEHV